MPKRTTYRNGDPITLACGCDGCTPSMINGILCHEKGCPESWKDYKRECLNCGQSFYPKEKGDSCCCQECHQNYYSW